MHTPSSFLLNRSEGLSEPLSEFAVYLLIHAACCDQRVLQTLSLCREAAIAGSDEEGIKCPTDDDAFGEVCGIRPPLSDELFPELAVGLTLTQVDDRETAQGDEVVEWGSYSRPAARSRASTCSARSQTKSWSRCVACPSHWTVKVVPYQTGRESNDRS